MSGTLLLIVLIITTLIPTSCSRKLLPEEKALKLAEESYALGGDQSVKKTIDKWLRERGEEVRPAGWHVTKKHDQVYLVGYKYKIYSFKEGTGERGFFFEVDLASGSVRNVTREVARKMGSLSPSFKTEGEIPEQFMQEWKEQEKILPGRESEQAPSALK